MNAVLHAPTSADPLAKIESIPLYSPANHPDGWHQVTAPGGYEWWYFDAEDPATDTQIVAILLEGFIFHPGYLRHWAKYTRRPTRTKPPMPTDYACAYLCVYRGGTILHQFMTQYRADQFRASPDGPDVAIGPNRLWRDGDSLRLSLRGAPWKLTGQGPKTLTDRVLRAELTLTPKLPHPPAERTFLSRAMTGADHHWVLANPLCAMTGWFSVDPVESADANESEGLSRAGRGLGEGRTATPAEATANSAASRTAGAAISPASTLTLPSPCKGEGLEVEQPKAATAFAGLAYHDHNYGTAPIGPGLKRWIWGRVLLGDRVTTFHYACPNDTSLPDEPHLVEADAREVREVRVARVEGDWSRRNATLLAYPDALTFRDADGTAVLSLSQPRLIDSAPFYMRLQYQATVRGRAGTAFCEVAYPHRLRWPILGRMIEMSIDKRALR
jgi:hypothetical protein